MFSASLPSSTSTSHITATFEAPSLTTTFVPPPECTAGHLTMMEDQRFSIFLNEPVPVPNTTITSCYPSQVGNSFLLSAAGTTLPAFSPLVCPESYTIALNGTDGYIACCPSGYLLNSPKTLVSSRPAFGAQCFTPITSVIATFYGDSTLEGTRIFSQASGAQAFAYPIDGFALIASDSSSSVNTTFTQASTYTSTSLQNIISTSIRSSESAISNSSSGSLTASSSNHTTSGAIAGIVIGATAFLLLLCAALLLFIRNHRLKAALARTGYRRGATELDATKPPVEMPGDSPSSEINGQSFTIKTDHSFYREEREEKEEKR